MMKSTIVTVTSEESGIQEALTMTEALGVENGLEKKGILSDGAAA